MYSLFCYYTWVIFFRVRIGSFGCTTIWVMSWNIGGSPQFLSVVWFNFYIIIFVLEFFISIVVYFYLRNHNRFGNGMNFMWRLRLNVKYIVDCILSTCCDQWWISHAAKYTRFKLRLGVNKLLIYRRSLDLVQGWRF